jgi:hypothetical protein
MIDDYTPERRWSYVEPTDDGVTPVEVTMTEKEILDIYWEYWSVKMREVGKEDQISEKACVDDWIVVNWAYQKDL